MTSDDFLDVFATSPFEDELRDVGINPTPQPDALPEPVVLRAEMIEPGTKPQRIEPSRDIPVALIFPSQDSGTGFGHVVIRQANNEVTCICWPALRSARGCHAMVSARAMLGLPPIE